MFDRTKWNWIGRCFGSSARLSRISPSVRLDIIYRLPNALIAVDSSFESFKKTGSMIADLNTAGKD